MWRPFPSNLISVSNSAISSRSIRPLSLKTTCPFANLRILSILSFLGNESPSSTSEVTAELVRRLTPFMPLGVLLPTLVHFLFHGQIREPVRRPDQLRDFVTVLKLRAIDFDDRSWILQQGLGGSLYDAGLHRARRAEEENFPIGRPTGDNSAT
jgi:hypothetical protein